MGVIGLGLAFGPKNDIGIASFGFGVGDLVEDLHAGLFGHPGYAALLDRGGRDDGDAGHDAGDAITDYLGFHEPLSAFPGSHLDPLLGAVLDDLALRASLAVGDLPPRPRGDGPYRCVVALVVSSSLTGSAVVCGGGGRLGEALADAIASLQAHPLLPALAHGREPTVVERRRMRRFLDPVAAELALELD